MGLRTYARLRPFVWIVCPFLWLAYGPWLYVRRFSRHVWPFRGGGGYKVAGRRRKRDRRRW